MHMHAELQFECDDVLETFGESLVDALDLSILSTLDRAGADVERTGFVRHVDLCMGFPRL